MTLLIEHNALIAHCGPRRVTLETLPPGYQARALERLGYSRETAAVFGYGRAERAKVVELGRRKGVLA